MNVFSLSALFSQLVRWGTSPFESPAPKLSRCLDRAMFVDKEKRVTHKEEDGFNYWCFDYVVCRP